jgi:hypothetical protein
MRRPGPATEGEPLKFPSSRIGPGGQVAITALVVAAAAAVPALASGSGAGASSEYGTTIYIKGSTPNSLHFVGPKKINEGEPLKIVNATDPKKVGPQTFTLVVASEIPATNKAREACLSKGGLCKAIIGWHKIKGNSAKTKLIEAGQEGWDTEGTRTSRGDSWFTGAKRNASIEQVVKAGATVSPITLTFMSALDPSLHGSITVQPLR